MAESTEPRRPPLRLPQDCSIAAIRSVYDLIREAFRRQDSVEIDCSSVAKADVTSIQLLLSTAKTGQASGRRVTLTAFSQNLRNTLRRAGFSNEAIAGHPFNEKKDGDKWPQS
jgi:ABC-type transporter Mla MlaB component